MFELLIDSILYASLILFGIGIFLKTNARHISRTFGWLLFGIFWTVHLPIYLYAGDALYAFATLFALPVCAFIAYHEYKSYKWAEEYEPLRFVTIATFVATTTYFVIDRIPILTATIIYIVAVQSCALANLLGQNYQVESIDFNNNLFFYRTNYGGEVHAHIANSSIDLVLACTALQAIVAALAFVLALNADRKRKYIALAVTLPTIYIMNLIRNAVVFYLVDNNITSFYVAHNYIGKIGISLITMILLILYLFYKLPEFYENINGLCDLPWRKKPGHPYRKYIGRLGAPKF
jgi:archaeosortase A (PGF-CTERM-specific)